MELGTRKREPSTPLAMRLSVWLLFLIVAAFFYFDRSPIPIESEPIPFKPYEIKRVLNADVVVVVDYESIRASEGTFSKKDWSAAWIDTFEQEIGPISVTTPQTLTAETLSTCRILVLTHSAADVPDALLEGIRSRVREGMMIVLERPSGALRRAFSADGEATERPVNAITFSSELAQPYDAHLENIPLFGSYVASRSGLERSTTHLAFDGAPVIYVTKVGSGFAVTVDFDYGELITSIQQGRGNEDFTIESRDPMRAQPDTSDLIASSKLDGANVPYADLIERFFVWRVLAHHTPIAAIWPFPDDRKGVVMLVHDDNELGERAEWLAKYEASKGATATFLMSYDVFGEEVPIAKSEVGFLWRLETGEEVEREPLGVAGWEPLSRPIGLMQQFNNAKEVAGAMTTSMIEGGKWKPIWDEPFRDLSVTNVRIDMSYQVDRTNGFSFGTGFPFLVLSREGVPIGLRELPVVLNHGARRGPATSDIIESATSGYHVPLTYRQPASWFSRRPDPEQFSEWNAFLDQMVEENVWLTDVRSYDLFLRSRRASGIRSRLIEDAPVPWLPRRPSENPRGEPTETATLFRVTAQAKAGGMSIVVPERFGDARIFTIREKSKKVEEERVAAEVESRSVNLIGIPLRVVPVESGFSTVDVYYR